MSFQIKAASAAGGSAAAVCAECGAPASDNFCSKCGADLRAGAAGVLGAVSGGVLQNFPGHLPAHPALTHPKRTVALADDPAYRSAHLLLPERASSIFCCPHAAVSSIQFGRPYRRDGCTTARACRRWLKILSQVGRVRGIAHYVPPWVLRCSASLPRSRAASEAYLKLYCLAFGFIMPPYAVYDYVARGVLGQHRACRRLQGPGPTPSEQIAVRCRFCCRLRCRCSYGPTSSPSTGAFGACRCGRPAALYTGNRADLLLRPATGSCTLSGTWVAFWLVRTGVVTDLRADVLRRQSSPGRLPRSKVPSCRRPARALRAAPRTPRAGWRGSPWRRWSA